MESCGLAACVLTGNGHVVRVDFATRRVISDRALPAGTVTDHFAVSPDGTRIAVATAAGALVVVDPTTGAVIESLGSGTRDVRPLAFSPDGSVLASRDFNDVFLWRLGSAQLPERLAGHSGRVVSAAFAPDGATLATGADDRTLITWDLTARHRLASVLTRGVTSLPTTLWVSGTTAVVGELGGALQFIDLGSGAVSATVGDNPHLGAPGILTARTGLAGGPLVVADQNALTAEWDLATHRLLGVVDVPPAQPDFTEDTWVSPDSTLAATIRSGAGPMVIDVATRTVVRQLPILPGARSAVLQTAVMGWSADGKKLLIARKLAGRSELLVVDAVTGIIVLRAPIEALDVVEIAADPLGRFYAVALDDGTVHFLDAIDGHELAPTTSSVGQVYNVSVSPDGQYVSATGSISVVRIWDTRTFREVGTPLPLDVGAPDARARFAPDGRLVVTSGHAVRIVEVGVDDWIARACREVGRSLTADEWRDVLPDRPYTPACT
jgi:WD40 repeat protein